MQKMSETCPRNLIEQWARKHQKRASYSDGNAPHYEGPKAVDAVGAVVVGCSGR